MNYPSVETLGLITGDKAKARRLRDILESIGFGPVCKAMKRIEAEGLLSISTYGVEVIHKGKGAKSPSIMYLNNGDSYTWTLLYIYGKGFRVGCWGDIVERGKYE